MKSIPEAEVFGYIKPDDELEQETTARHKKIVEMNGKEPISAREERQEKLSGGDENGLI